MNHNDTLKEILIAIANNVHNYSHIKDLIRITRAYSHSFLKNHKPEAIRFAANNGLDLEDLVEDTIADLFAKDSDNNFLILNKFLNSLNDTVKEINPKKLFLAYYSLTVKFVSLQLAKIYTDHDPNGAAIYKNINVTIKKVNIFEVYKTKGDSVLLLREWESSSHKKYIDYEEFLKGFLTKAQGRKNTRELILIIHDLLDNQSHYRKEIKIIDVVKLFKAYFRYEERIIEDNDTSLSNSDFNLLEQTEIEQLINKVTDNIKRKIFTDYYAKGKLCRSEALGLADTINDILNDWIDIGTNGQSNFDYLNRFISVNADEYNLRFKAKLEYLIKLSKEQLRFYFENA